MKLVYSGTCPICRRVELTIRMLDRPGWVETIPIESEEGWELVNEHHGEYVHSPHLFTEERVYYGVWPTAKGLAKEYAGNVKSAVLG